MEKSEQNEEVVPTDQQIPTVVTAAVISEDFPKSTRSASPVDEAIDLDIRTDLAWDRMLALKGVKIVEFYAGWADPSFPLLTHGKTMVNKYSTDACPVRYFTACSDFVNEGSKYRGRCRPMTHIFVDSNLLDIITGVDVLTIEENVNNCVTNYYRSSTVQTETPQTPGESLEEEDDELVSHLGKTVYNVGRSASLENLVALVGERLDRTNWVVERPLRVKLRLLMIKPDIAKNENAVQKIVTLVENSGLIIFKQSEYMLKTEVLGIITAKDENLKADEKIANTKFLMSGPVIILVVYAGETGEKTDNILKQIVGDYVPSVAKRTHPKSIRALYGKNVIHNAVEFTTDDSETRQLLNLIFPKPNTLLIDGGVPYREFKLEENTLAIIRPTAVKKFGNRIVKDIENAGFDIMFSKLQLISNEEALKIYSVHKNRYYFDDLLKEMTCGKANILLLQKQSAINDFRTLIGPASKEKLAKRPNALRSKYDMWETGVNCVHGSANLGSARFEVELFFPVQTTVAIIKPEYMESMVDDIIRVIRRNKFSVVRQKKVTISRKVAFKMYKHLENQPYYPRLITYMISGPSIAMILKREDALDAWKRLIGPFNPRQARRENPEYLRAKYGDDEVRNAVHGSTDSNAALELIDELFDKSGETHALREYPKTSNIYREEVSRKGEDSIFDPAHDLFHDKAEYLIQLVTENGPLCPKVPDVYMVLEGNDGRRTDLLSLMVPLSLKSPFISGAIDTYLHRDIDVGSIAKIELIGMSEGGFPDGWHVRSFEIVNRTTGNIFFVGVDAVVQPTEGMSIAYTDIIESKTKERFENDFDVLIETGAGKYTGTQAAANLFLIDEKGQESHTNLLTSLSGTYLPLENGRKSVFQARREPGFGTLTKLRINQKTQRSAPAWFIERIVVVDKFNDEINVFNFPVHRWLDEHFADRKTELTLEIDTFPRYDQEFIRHIEKTETRYSILTRTGYMPEASFDGAVKVTLYGKDATTMIFSSYLEISENSFYPFEYGSVDEFVYYSNDIGELSKIEIHAEESETTGAWFLDFIRVEVGYNRVYHYEIGHFLNVEEGGCVITIDVSKGYERPKSNEKWQDNLLRARSTVQDTENPPELIDQKYDESLYQLLIYTNYCHNYVEGSIMATIEIVDERGSYDHLFLPQEHYQTMFTRESIVSFNLLIRNIYCPTKAWIRLLRKNKDNVRKSMVWKIDCLTISKQDVAIKIRLQPEGIICLSSNQDVALQQLNANALFDKKRASIR